MKKIFILIMLSLVLSACNSNSEESNGNTSDSSSGESFTFTTSNQSSSTFAMGGALGELINKETDHHVTVIPSGGSVENVQLFRNKEVEIGYLASDQAYYAYHGINNFEGEPLENINSFVMGSPFYFNFIVRKDSDIKEFEDIKGKIIGVGPPGSSNSINVKHVLEGHGITFDDVDARTLTLGEQVDALKDGNIDVFAYVSGGEGSPSPAIVDLMSGIDIRFLEIKDDVAEKIAANHPYEKATIAKDFYTGIDEVKTLSLGFSFLLSDDVSEEVAYELAKTFWENKDALDEAHNSWKPARLTGLPVPLHPGVKKYYEETGKEWTVLE